MKIIGITGGVGSGKSRVLSYIETTYDAYICQADHVAWELQMPGQDCYKEIVRQFGRHVLNSDESINRKALGQIVFQDQDKLMALNQIMHPAVKRRIVELIAEISTTGRAFFFIEAALLLEENYAQICDEIWYIYSEESVRRTRLKESRQYHDAKIDAIMSAQLPEKTFRKQCQVTIDNSGDFADTCHQVDKAMNQ